VKAKGKGRITLYSPISSLKILIGVTLGPSALANMVKNFLLPNGLKCETGLYGRSPDKSARVCKWVQNTQRAPQNPLEC